MAKPLAVQMARKLRLQGLPIGEIAERVGATKEAVSDWVQDIHLTDDQIQELLLKNPLWERQQKGASVNRERAVIKRQRYQEEGKAKALENDIIHLKGCILYWAEGAKQRNSIHFVNSDPDMMVFFMRFLRQSLDVKPEQIKLQIHCHTTDPDEHQRIASYWLNLLDMPLSCLTKIQVKKGSTSRHNRLVNGLCAIRIFSTQLTHHIYGAIQEYGGFEKPEWLF